MVLMYQDSVQSSLSELPSKMHAEEEAKCAEVGSDEEPPTPTVTVQEGLPPSLEEMGMKRGAAWAKSIRMVKVSENRSSVCDAYACRMLVCSLYAAGLMVRSVWIGSPVSDPTSQREGGEKGEARHMADNVRCLRF